MLESLIQKSELTKAEKQARASKNLISSLESAYSVLSITQKNIFTIIWDNPQGLTPQEVMDALGAKAKEFLNLNDAIITFLTTTAPTKVLDDASIPYKEVLPQSDGTVIVTETPNVKRVDKGLPTTKIK